MRYIFSTSIIALTATFALTSCQKPSETAQRITASEPAIEVEQVQTAGDIIVKKEPVNYTLPACEGKECPEVDIQRLETNKPWINQFLDRKILTLSNLQFSEEVIKPTTVQANLDRFVASAKQDAIARGQPVAYSLQVTPEFLGQRGQVVMFKIITAYYTGGAHGGASDNYYNLDLKQKKQLTLNDIILPNQQQKLRDQLYLQFSEWVKKNDSKVNLVEYEQNWPFTLTENFSFTETGLLFSYAQYEIGPYAAGMPEFVMPYTQLNGIIKPEYLAVTSSQPTRKPSGNNAASSPD
ncbi:MAG: DUF3298 domain-containing protein [Moraxellaceae bacterium]|nr:MAG: DUF3298 domain-containing protein [Moraxellaceae bacterium]